MIVAGLSNEFLVSSLELEIAMLQITDLVLQFLDARLQLVDALTLLGNGALEQARRRRAEESLFADHGCE